MRDDRLLRRLAKLKALIEHQGTPEEEVLNALGVFKRLVDTHQVEEWEIDGAVGASETRVVCGDLGDTFARLADSELHVLLSLAGAFDCSVLKGGGRLYLIGVAEDVEIVSKLAAPVMTKAVLLAAEAAESWPGGRDRAFVSYLVGFGEGLKARVESFRTNPASGALVRRKDDLLRQFYEDAGLPPKELPVTVRVEKAAHSAGWLAGWRSGFLGTKEIEE